MKVGTAHQKLVRDQKAQDDLNNLFGNYWEEIDKDLKKAVVKPIDFHTAKDSAS